MNRFADVALDLLDQGYQIHFSVRGPSMHPHIQDGDRVTLAPVPKRADSEKAGQVSEILRKGDVVLFRAERGLVLHRIVALSGPSCQVRGDAYGSGEETILVKQILGRAVAIERVGVRRRVSGRMRLLLSRIRHWLSTRTSSLSS